MILGPLYHWAPTGRRTAIEAHGLRPSSAATVATEPLQWVCLGFSPSGAWSLSGAAVDDAAGAGSWDLWQVTMPLLDADDPVTVRPGFGPWLREVQVGGVIDPGRLWLVGTRFRAAGGDPWKTGVVPFAGKWLQ